MSKTGERLPYLLGKLKAPRVLERLEQTAALAREQSWPYARFLETLLEAEVFAATPPAPAHGSGTPASRAEEPRRLRLERAARSAEGLAVARVRGVLPPKSRLPLAATSDPPSSRRASPPQYARLPR
jgi:hypothetical protein